MSKKETTFLVVREYQRKQYLGYKAKPQYKKVTDYELTMVEAENAEAAAIKFKKAGKILVFPLSAATIFELKRQVVANPWVAVPAPNTLEAK